MDFDLISLLIGLLLAYVVTRFFSHKPKETFYTAKKSCNCKQLNV